MSLSLSLTDLMVLDLTVVVRHNDTTLASVSEVKLSRARLLPEWVTVQGIQSHLGQLSLPSLRGR
jgi:hypothetical protein